MMGARKASAVAFALGLACATLVERRIRVARCLERVAWRAPAFGIRIRHTNLPIEMSLARPASAGWPGCVQSGPRGARAVKRTAVRARHRDRHGRGAGTPAPMTYESIAMPTLIQSREDDLVGIADTARLLADRIPDARLVVSPNGGHIWLGHDAALTREIGEFVTQTGRS